MVGTLKPQTSAWQPSTLLGTPSGSLAERLVLAFGGGLMLLLVLRNFIRIARPMLSGLLPMNGC